eukprot:6491834-Amphidinium_carterae.2
MGEVLGKAEMDPRGPKHRPNMDFSSVGVAACAFCGAVPRGKQWTSILRNHISLQQWRSNTGLPICLPRAGVQCASKRKGNPIITERGTQGAIIAPIGLCLHQVNVRQQEGRYAIPADSIANLALGQATAMELTIPWRTSAPYEHQSQEAIQRFHKTWYEQYALTWLTVHSDGLTNYQRRWGVKYNQQFATLVRLNLVHKEPAKDDSNEAGLL